MSAAARMNMIEIDTGEQRAVVPRTDTPGRLMDGLKHIVVPGITERHNDVAWVYYEGPAERLANEANLGYQLLVGLLMMIGTDLNRQSNSVDINLRPNPGDLVSNIITQHGQNDTMHRIKDLMGQRFVAAPARYAPGEAATLVELDLEHAIAFDGGSLAVAMYKDGFDVETVDQRAGMPAVYRDAQIGAFFAKHAATIG